jgi:hypothetical protein
MMFQVAKELSEGNDYSPPQGKERDRDRCFEHQCEWAVRRVHGMREYGGHMATRRSRDTNVPTWLGHTQMVPMRLTRRKELGERKNNRKGEVGVGVDRNGQKRGVCIKIENREKKMKPELPGSRRVPSC